MTRIEKSGHHRFGLGPSSTRRSAFTLIELLTVISIIGLLAGLVIGLAPGVQKSMRVKRVQAELNQLVTALEDYKAKFGHGSFKFLGGFIGSLWR